MPELIQFDIGTSMRRYAPPIGTAGFARREVSGRRRVPAPPPKMMAPTLSLSPGFAGLSGSAISGASATGAACAACLQGVRDDA